MQQMEQIYVDINKRNCPKTSLPREELKAIWSEAIAGDTRLLTVFPLATRMFQKNCMLDALFLKYDIEFQTLVYAVKEHKIDQDEDILARSAEMQAVKKEAHENEEKKNGLYPETIAKIISEVALLPDCPEKGQEKVLNFDYWLGLFRVLTFSGAYEQFLFRKTGVAERRDTLIENPSQYYKLLYSHQ